MMLGDHRRVSYISQICLPYPDLFAGIYLRHGPDAQSVFLTFASAFLVKVLLVALAFSSFRY